MMVNFNKVKEKKEVTNLAGGKAYALNPKMELLSILLTSFLKDSFYQKGDKTLENLVKVINKIEDKNITYTEKDAAITIVRSEDIVAYNVKRESAPATPSVRRLARELGVDIDRVSGSGQGGRIMEEDVKNFVKIKLTSTDAGNPVSQKKLPDFKKWGDVEIQSMNKVRVITAEAMTYAWSTIPMVTQSDKADITELEEFRKKYSKSVEEKGGHLTLTSMLVKVCSAALNKFPQFNSSIDLNKKEIVL